MRNKEHQKEYNKKYAQRHKSEVNKHNRKSYYKHKDERRTYYIEKTYGINKKDFDRLMVLQNNRCGICKILIEAGNHKSCIDHDHKTGKVRGLLCSNCNLGIGYFKEDILVLESSINYLKGESK
jgi:hypothetical protein